MQICTSCGKEVLDGTLTCPWCGAPQGVAPNPNQQPYTTQTPTDSGSVGWGILGFLIPLVGLILYLVWRKTKPRCARMAGWGALIGVCWNVLRTFF